MEGFREGKGATGAEAEALLEAARRELEVVRRQAAVQGLYKAPHKSYMVRTSPPPPPPPARACWSPHRAPFSIRSSLTSAGCASQDLEKGR